LFNGHFVLIKRVINLGGKVKGSEPFFNFFLNRELTALARLKNIVLGALNTVLALVLVWVLIGICCLYNTRAWCDLPIYQFTSVGVIDRSYKHLKAIPVIPSAYDDLRYNKWLYFVKIYRRFGLKRCGCFI
jgi:hypothetical protein